MEGTAGRALVDLVGVSALVLLAYLVFCARVLRGQLARAFMRGDLARYGTVADAFPFVRPLQRQALQAEVLFWSGRFEDSLRLLDPSRAGHGFLAALDLAMLDRHDEARAMLAHVSREVGYPGHESTLELVSALLAYAEGDLSAARSRLIPLLDGGDPISRVAHYTVAMMALELNDVAVARPHLERTIDGGGDIFVVDLAVARYKTLFPLRPPPPRTRPDSAPTRELGDLAINLGRGIRLASFQPSRADFLVSPEQLALLASLNMALSFGLSLVEYARGNVMFRSGPLDAIAWGALLVPLAYVIGRIVAQPGAMLRASVMCLSAAPIVILCLHPIHLALGAHGMAHVPRVVASWISQGAAALWVGAIVARVVLALGPPRALLRALVGSCVTLVAMALFAESSRHLGLWYRPLAWPTLAHVEQRGRVLEDQPAKLNAALARLPPQRPSVTDVYFVGFAGWGDQDVFKNEVHSFASLFESRPSTGARSVLLVNDDETPGRVPIASMANLRVVLQRIGATIDRDEDVLFLMMTSHGSAQGLGARLLDEPLAPIEPTELREALDASGIRWRILVVSGCESGTFIDALREDHTLVATAAAKDRASFGCESGRNFTEYGKAVYQELAKGGSIVGAVERAMQRVSQRETAEKLTSSLPQLVVGPAIAEKLREIE